jgi:hypothetical protein
MAAAAWGVTVSRVEWALTEYGPMTRAQLQELLSLDGNQISGVISRMSKRGKDGVKRISIKAWVYDHDAARRYPRAVYALGDRKNARRPRASRAETARRYKGKKKALNTMNFVFNLGLSERNAGVRK